MKSLPNRRGNLLDTAPSFLVRQKAINTTAFTQSGAQPDHATSHDDIVNTPTTTRVMPLRPATAPSMQAATQALQTAQIAEVELLDHESALSTFRTFQSFGYTASLLFLARELIYFVVLYREGAVWRVLKTEDIDAAGLAFRHYVEQAMRLAEADMQCARLEAQNEKLARIIADSEAQIERARADLQRGRAQDQEVAMKQQDVRKALAQLDSRRIASQVQLNKLQRQLHQLKSMAGDSVPHLSSSR